MNFLDYPIMILYSAAAIVCVVLLVKFLVEACIGSPKGWRERARLKALKRELATVSERFKENNFSDGKKTLRTLFHFDIVKNDADVIEQVTAYHHGLLQQIITYGKAHTFAVNAFEILEDLVLSRTGLLRSYFEAELSKRALLKKGGKKIPGWALEEYSKKISDLREKLETNQKSILLQFEKSVGEDSPKSLNEEIVYH